MKGRTPSLLGTKCAACELSMDLAGLSLSGYEIRKREFDQTDSRTVAVVCSKDCVIRWAEREMKA